MSKESLNKLDALEKCLMQIKEDTESFYNEALDIIHDARDIIASEERLAIFGG